MPRSRNTLLTSLILFALTILIAFIAWQLFSQQSFAPSNSQPRTPSPTATFEPLTDEPIMGFMFSKPRPLDSTRPIKGVMVGEWLPFKWEKNR